MLLENARVDRYDQQHHQAAEVGREGQDGPFVNRRAQICTK